MDATQHQLEQAQAGYVAFGESLNWRDAGGAALPQWSALPEPVRQAWCAAARHALQAWLWNECRDALLDPERVAAAVAMLAVGLRCGDPPPELVRRTVAGFVVSLIDPEILRLHGG